MIAEIESDWRETPLTCSVCGPEHIMYSDGENRPECMTCFRGATDVEIYDCLTRPTPAERKAQYNADELRAALRDVQRLLARGRTVGNDWQKAALDAENYIIGLLGVPGQPDAALESGS